MSETDPASTVQTPRPSIPPTIPPARIPGIASRAKRAICRLYGRWWYRPAILTASVAVVASAIYLFPLAYLWFPFAWTSIFDIPADRAFVLADREGADAEVMRLLGRHFIVSADIGDDLLPLIGRGAVGGVYISKAFAGQRSETALKASIALFQTTALEANLPPLLVVADQEGGSINHLSPPLPRATSLRTVAEAGTLGNLEDRCRALGNETAQHLSRVGVTMNLAPVVDLLPLVNSEQGTISLHSDRTQLGLRALSADPDIVTRAARAYVVGLNDGGIRAAVKHFPGLGAVTQDTHLYTGSVLRPLEELNANDWKPFSLARSVPGTAVMVGHVVVPAIDPVNPASVSEAIVNGTLRETLGFAGAVISDDFSMFPIVNRAGGVGRASIDALLAGVDIVLISWRPSLYYSAMAAVLRADANGEIPRETLRRSASRLPSMLGSPDSYGTDSPGRSPGTTN